MQASLPPKQRMAAVDALLGRAAAAGLALVAGKRLAAAEIGAARALQEVAANGRHVAQLLRRRPPQRFRERRILGHEPADRLPRRSSAPGRRRPARAPLVSMPSSSAEPGDIDDVAGRLDVELHQIVERGAAGQKARAAAAGRDGACTASAAVFALHIGEGLHGSRPRASCGAASSIAATMPT